MSKLMQVLGIILLAAGIALAVMGFVNQAPLQVRGIDMATAINLIVGGILAFGLGGVISAIGSGGLQTEASGYETASTPETVSEAEAEAEAKPDDDKPAAEAAAPRPMRFPSFSRKLEAAGVAAAPAAVTETVTETVTTKTEEVVTPAVQETITALEQAKSDLEAALTGPAEVAEAVEGELYVVEDKVIRGHPARVLSDGTVEAETDEGWMRFENLEHLDEYLDAVEQA